MSPALYAVSLAKLCWVKTVERSRTHLALTFLIHSCPALLVIVMKTVLCMRCNMEEQACVKEGTPCRRSGERGEQFGREVSDLSSGGEREWRRICGCCGSFSLPSSASSSDTLKCDYFSTVSELIPGEIKYI